MFCQQETGVICTMVPSRGETSIPRTDGLVESRHEALVGSLRLVCWSILLEETVDWK